MSWFTDLLKSGASSLMGGAISTGLGLASNSIGYLQNKKLMSKQYQYNLALQQDAQNYNTTSMGIANQYNVQNAATAQGYMQDNMNLDARLQRENWQFAFDLQNAYNDPSAQRARLENAGYNPQLANGNVNTLGGSGMSGSASSGAPQASGSSALASPSASVGSFNAPSVDFAKDFSLGVDAVNHILSTAVQNDVGRNQIHKMASEYTKNMAESAAIAIQNAADSITYVDNAGNKIPNPDYVEGDDNGQPYLTVKQAREMKMTQEFDENVEFIVKKIVNLDFQSADLAQKIKYFQEVSPDLAQTIKQTLKNLEDTNKQIRSMTSWYDEQTTDIRSTRGARIGALVADANSKNAQAEVYRANKEVIDQLLTSGYYVQLTHLLMNQNRLTNVKGSEAIFYFNRAKKYLSSDVGSALDYFKKGYDCISDVVDDGIQIYKTAKGGPSMDTYETGPRYTNVYNNY